MRTQLLLLLLAVLAVPAWSLEPIDSEDATPWLGPELLDPGKAGVGQRVPDVGFHSLEGGATSLHAVAGERGTVVVVRDPRCPVSQRYGPRVGKMARYYDHHGIRFVFIYLNNNVEPRELVDDARALAAPGVMVGQGSFEVAEKLGVRSTGDVFVLDADHRLLYRGAVDDQYGFGYTQDAPTRNYLRNAMDALLSGQIPAVPATLAPGCIIDADPAKDRLFPISPDEVLS